MKNPLREQPGVGLKLIGYAAREARRLNKTLLRCDTVADSEGLLNYYRKLGFETKGHFVYPATGRDGLLLEVPVEQVLLTIDSQLPKSD